MIRTLARFKFRDNSHRVGAYQVFDLDFFVGEYNISESAITSLRKRLEAYWSEGRPRSYFEAISRTALVFRVRREDRAVWEQFLKRLLKNPKNAVDCCPEVRGIPRGMSA